MIPVRGFQCTTDACLSRDEDGRYSSVDIPGSQTCVLERLTLRTISKRRGLRSSRAWLMAATGLNRVPSSMHNVFHDRLDGIFPIMSWIATLKKSGPKGEPC